MSAYDEFELAEAVGAGAEFMDAIDPDWFWIVDPERLDMGSTTRRTGGCITAQHHPTGIVNFGDYGLNSADWMDALAFNIAWTAGKPGVDVLTALWREAIDDRRAAWFDSHPEYVISEAS